MTRSELLCHLMASPNERTVERLGKIYGRNWHDPVRGLIDLGIVVYMRCPNTGKHRFDVIEGK